MNRIDATSLLSALGKLNAEYASKAQGVLTVEQLNRFKASTAKREK